MLRMSKHEQDTAHLFISTEISSMTPKNTCSGSMLSKLTLVTLISSIAWLFTHISSRAKQAKQNPCWLRPLPADPSLPKLSTSTVLSNGTTASLYRFLMKLSSLKTTLTELSHSHTFSKVWVSSSLKTTSRLLSIFKTLSGSTRCRWTNKSQKMCLVSGWTTPLLKKPSIQARHQDNTLGSSKSFSVFLVNTVTQWQLGSTWLSAFTWLTVMDLLSSACTRHLKTLRWQ